MNPGEDGRRRRQRLKGCWNTTTGLVVGCGAWATNGQKEKAEATRVLEHYYRVGGGMGCLGHQWTEGMYRIKAALFQVCSMPLTVSYY